MSLFVGSTATLLGETHQGDIRHGVDHDSLVLHCVLSDSPEARFQHVVPVEERLLCSRFHPHLKLNMSQCFSWCYNWVQLHLFALYCHWKTVYIVSKQELNMIPSMHLSKHHHVTQRSKRSGRWHKLEVQPHVEPGNTMMQTFNPVLRWRHWFGSTSSDDRWSFRSYYLLMLICGGGFTFKCNVLLFKKRNKSTWLSLLKSNTMTKTCLNVYLYGDKYVSDFKPHGNIYSLS